MSNHQIRNLFIFLISSLLINTAYAGIMYGPETFSSTDGLLQTVTRTINLGDSTPGQYLLKIQNGAQGPALLEQCATKATPELRNQCAYENLVDRNSNQLTRLSTLIIKVNGVSLSPTTLVNKSSNYLEFPITLSLPSNEVKISVQGNPEAFVNLQVEEITTTPLPPRALFLLNSNYGRAPFNVSFNASSSFDPLNKALTYEWLVNNQLIASTKTGTYTFQNEGQYELKLIVTNTDGLTSELATTIITQPAVSPPTNLKPAPKITVSYPDPFNLRLIKVSTLDSVDPDGFIQSTTINFGDGSSTITATESLHQYASDGTFLISIRATDDDGGYTNLDKSVAISLNNQLSKVETIWGPQNFYGSLSNETITDLSFNIDPDKTNDLYRIRIKNADGLNHAVQSTCTGSTSDIIMCHYNNILSSTYISLNRVDYAHIFVNNKKITDSSSINKNKQYFETYLRLAEINQLKIKQKGWPSTYITVEIERLGEVPDETAPVLSSNISSGALVRSNLIHVVIEDNSNISTEIYKEGVYHSTTTDKEFDLTLVEGSNNFTLKSKDSLNNIAGDFLLHGITLDSTPSTISSPDKIQNYLVNTLPNTVTMHFEGNEELASATANGEALERVSPTKFKYTTQVFDPGLKFITTKLYDLAGNETSQGYNFAVTLDTVAPIITSTYAIPASTKSTYIRLWMKVTEDTSVTNVFKVNGNIIGTSTNKSPQLDFPLVEGSNTLEAISTDTAGNVSTPLTAIVVRDSISPTITVSPVEGTTIPGLSFVITGTSNEPLSFARVNSQNATISADRMSFTYNYSTTSYGNKTLTIQTKDDLLNSGTQSFVYTLQTPAVPVLTASIINGLFTNNPNVQVTASGNSISNLTVKLDNVELYNGNNSTFTYQTQTQGQHQLNISAKNSANVTTTQSYTYTYDSIAPTFTMTPAVVKTNESTASVQFNVTDATNTTTAIKVNGQPYADIHDKVFSQIIPLNLEGNNTIEATVTDQAGNVSAAQTVTIKKDTQGPLLTIFSPGNNLTMSVMQFSIMGAANEELASLTVNGASILLDMDRKGFTGAYQATQMGWNALNFVATDLLGNTSETIINVNLTNALLNQPLITVIPSSDGNFYYVTGREGASRPNSYITVDTGVFSNNRGSDTTKSNGTFSVKMSRFTQATVKAVDLVTLEEESFQLDFYVPTSIAGVVKDYNNNPLPGATVSILGSGISVQTDASGIFSLSDIPVGDQTLSIDGSTIPQSTVGSNRKFFTTNMAISVSAGMNNTLSRPIYLVPIDLDGTETQISTNQPATVISPNAPGVALSVPAGSVIFPTGSNSGAISIREIPSDRAALPVPENAVPDTVYSFEPAGTRFNQRVQVTFPNVNELEPGTEAYVLSLNSTSGEWEINGVAKVSEDGATITTKPGFGITHFSPKYVVPAKPYYESLQDPNLEGISVAKGAFETSVDLPSFKALGGAITPKLKYNSSWANPIAVVSNGFAVAKQEIKYQTSASDYSTSSIQVPLRPNLCTGGDLCPMQQVLREVWMTATLDLEAAFVPDSISSQTWVGLNAFDQTNYTITSSQLNSNNIPGVYPSSAIKTNKWTLTNNDNGTLIPNFSQITYAIPLRKPDGTNFPTGIYPSLTRYELKLKHLVMRTITTHIRQEYDHHDVPYNQDGFVNGVKVEPSLNSTAVNEIFPKDIQSKLLVQNKENSAYGKGWEFDPTQKILNHNASLILLEESDGSLSTYSASYPIETTFNANGTEYDLSYGAGINSWPNFYLQKYDVQNKTGKVYKVNPVTQSATLTSILSDTSGTSGLDNFDNCGNPNFPQTVTRHKFSFTQKPGFSNILELSNGSIIGSNTTANSVYNLSTQTSTLIGGGNYAFPGSFRLNTIQHGFSDKLATTCSVLNLDCYGLTNLNTTYNCSSTVDPHDESGQLFVPGSFPSSKLYRQDIRDWRSYDSFDNIITSKANTDGFNKPTGMTISPDGKIIIADTGNNVVLALNLQTNMTKIIAGDFRAFDGGDGGPAAPDVIYDIVKNNSINDFFVKNNLINLFHALIKSNKANAVAMNSLPFAASIYHPKGVAYDSQGNLYITSENGFIRKVNPQGVISTYAGRSMETGGTLADSGHAEIMRLTNPTGIVIDDDKQMMYIADSGNNRILQIDMTSKMATKIAGTGNCDLNPNDGGSALNASLCNPSWLGFDDQKNLIVIDSEHKRIRRIFTNTPTTQTLTYYPSRSGDLSTIIKNSNDTFTRKNRDGSQVQFDDEGKQISSQDRVGNTTTYEYVNNQLSQIKYPNTQGGQSGPSAQYSYASGKLSYFIDPAGRRTNFYYEGNLLKQIVFPDGSNKTLEYDDYERLTMVYDQRGNPSSVEYNDLGRVRSITDATGKVTTVNDVQSATLNNPKQIGTDSGKTSSTIKNANNVTISLAEDLSGFTAKFKDGNGVLTEIKRDVDGRPLKIIKNGGSRSASITYDPISKDILTTTNNVNGKTASYTYNSFGQVLTQKDNFNNVTTYQYAEATGLLTSKILPSGSSANFVHSNQGQILQATVHPIAGQSITTTYEYDLNGNISKTIASDGKITLYEYDSAGNNTKITLKIDENNFAVTTKEYDAFNRLKKVKSPKEEVTSYTYDNNGNLSSTTDPTEKITTYLYDNNNRQVSKTLPSGKVYLYGYDNVGNLISETDPNGNIKVFTYSNNNKITRAQFPDETIDYTYDILDQLHKIESSSQLHLTYFYNSDGQVLTENTIEYASSSAYSIYYAYNEIGNRISTELSTSDFSVAISPPTISNLQKISYQYDDDNQLTQISNIYGDVFNFNYDNAKQITSIVRPGSQTDFVYNSGSALARLDHSSAGITKSFTELTYDQRNIITQKRNPAGTYDYTYDKNGQITSSQNTILNENESFGYDSLGNRTSDNDQSYQYNSSNDNILTEDGTYTYIYDNNGNLTYKNSKTGSTSYKYEYSSRNQLKRIQIFTAPIAGTLTKQIDYVYDPVGRRIKKQITNYETPSKSFSRRYIYDGQNVIAEADSQKRILASYTHSPLMADDVLGVTYSKYAVSAANGGESENSGNTLSPALGSFYFLKDHIGSITDIIDSSGNIKQRYNYYAYGRISTIKDQNNQTVTFDTADFKNSFMFTGREWEEDAGLYYYRARYYDANIGRFLQKDPHPGRQANPITLINKYTYCGNNPISYTDPSGAIFGIDDLIFILIMGGVGAIAESHLNGDVYSIDNILNGFLKGAALGASIIGVSSIIGASFGSTSADPMIFSFNNINAHVMTPGALEGLLMPSLGAQIAAGILAIPAAIGLFSSNASPELKLYATFYSMVGFLGNLQSAAIATYTFPTADIATLPDPSLSVLVTEYYDPMVSALRGFFYTRAAFPIFNIGR